MAVGETWLPVAAGVAGADVAGADVGEVSSLLEPHPAATIAMTNAGSIATIRRLMPTA